MPVIDDRHGHTRHHLVEFRAVLANCEDVNGQFPGFAMYHESESPRQQRPEHLAQLIVVGGKIGSCFQGDLSVSSQPGPPESCCSAR